MDLSDFTAAEIYQMWAERMRMDWQHTSVLATYTIEANRGKKGKPMDPDSINPMESAQHSTGIPLNSPMAGEAMKAIAGSWRPGQS